MKIRLLFILIGFVCLSNPSFAQKEYIKSFDVQVLVNKDRSITVTEFISVWANNQSIKRGITRNFPAERQMNHRTVKVTYDIIDIQKNGQAEKYHTNDEGNDFTIYIGQRDVILKPGYYDYKIQYKVPNQIGFFKDYDEIYWNAIGTDVSFPIHAASCRVTIPTGANIIQEAAYVGYRGQRGKDYKKTEEGAILDYRINRKLESGEGLSVAIGFDKGVINQPNLFERYGTLMAILLGLSFLLPYYLYTWWKYGQDPPTPASYPIYDAPDDLSAASLNYISREGYQGKSFTGSIIDLAIKGYLKIRQKDSVGIFGSGRSYDLVKLKEASTNLPTEEKQLFEKLFSSHDLITVDGSYHSDIEDAYRQHKSSLSVQHSAFINKGNNSKLLTVPILTTLIAAAIAIFLFASNPYAEGFNLKSLFVFIPIAIGGIILYTYLIKKPTVEKLELKSRIKGFKMYLEMAEKDRLNLLNPPDLTPQYFEAALPFAFALGVEHQWSNLFKKILEEAQYTPNWNNSDPHTFSNDFGKSFSTKVSRSATKPSESSSGSGGGGSSGGGGGGGGVGGW